MEIDIVQSLLGFTMLGAEWVLWLLIGLSILSLSIILERLVYFFRVRIDYSNFANQLAALLAEKDYAKIRDLCQHSPAIEAQVALKGIDNLAKGRVAMEGSMEGLLVGHRQKLDRGLVVLGTLGNNAPFIGLFGTVIGIIQAFNDLSLNPQGGPSIVMSGISEALVATAVGLVVAIPAVIAFNAFSRVVKRHLANAAATIKVVMTYH